MRRIALFALSFVLWPGAFRADCQQRGSATAPRKERTLPGNTATGMLLPNGWTLTPEGTQVPVSDLPLNMEFSRDQRYLLVTTNGEGDQTIDIIELRTGRSVQAVSVKKSWLGTRRLRPMGSASLFREAMTTKSWSSTSPRDAPRRRARYSWAAANITRSTNVSAAEARRAGRGEFAFPAGIAVAPDGKRLYVAENLRQQTGRCRPGTQKVITKIRSASIPTTAVSR